LKTKQNRRHEQEKERMAALQAAGVGTSQYKADSLLDEDYDDCNNVDNDIHDMTYSENDGDADDHITGTLPDAADTEPLPDADTAMDSSTGDAAMDSSPDVSDRDSSDRSKSLMFFFDCETSGLSFYKHHITELAAKVVAPSDVSISTTEFSALCYTAINISPTGDYIK